MGSEPRLFVGLSVPDDVKAEIAVIQGAVRRQDRKGRFKGMDNFHLTLKFLGAVATDRLDCVVRQLALVSAQQRPFTIGLRNIGIFGDGQPARVVWLGVDGERGALDQVQQAVEQAATVCGFARERRSFAPHLTLAQDVVWQEDGLAVMGRRWATSLFFVTAIVLFRSDLVSGRRVYTPMRTFPLGEGACPDEGSC